MSIALETTPNRLGVLEAVRDFFNKQLVQHAFTFTTAEIVNKAIPFALLPLITRFLTAADYGVVATFTALLNILSVLVGLNVHGAVSVNFYQLSRRELSRYIANVFAIIAASGTSVVLLIVPFAGALSAKLKLPQTWIFLAVLLAAGQCITSINLVLWQAEQRPRPYGIYQVSQTLVLVATMLLLVVMLRWGWIGQLSSNLLSGGLFAALSLGFIAFRGFITLDIDRRYLRDALAFGLPLIPHALSGWFLTGVDRFLITSILGISSTGVYALGYQFGLVIGILAASFNKAWVPYLYSRLSTIDHVGKLRIVKFTYVYFLGILSFALLLAAVSPWVIKNILGKAFSGSAQFVLWVSLGFAFEGMYYMVVNQIFFVKKTHWLAAITFSVGVLHIAVSYLCIRHFGAVGAAYATTISFGTTFLTVWILSARVYPMPWLFWRTA